MAETPASLPATRRWLRVTLVLSLMLNLLLVGLAVGAAVNFRQEGGPPRALDITAGPLGRALEPEDRRALARAVRGAEEGRPPSRSERAATVAEMADLLRRTPFDAAAFAALIEAQGERQRAVQSTVQAAFVAQVEAMTPPRRAALADKIEAEVQRTRDEARDRD